jgi:ADP-ribosyl-[dinitrogen reductase] hydrolase
MSVYLEFFDVLVPVDVLEQKYPGGVAAYGLLSPGTFCNDGHLTRVGFMSHWDANDFLAHLESAGLTIVEDGVYKDVATSAPVGGATGARRPPWLVVVGGTAHHAAYPAGKLVIPSANGAEGRKGSLETGPFLRQRKSMFRAEQLRSDLLPSPAPGPKLQDKYRGCLVGGAIGDALGRPVESWPARLVADRYPTGLRDFEADPGWSGGPVGTITDDTQMTMLVAEHLLDDEGHRLTDLVHRIMRWGTHGRGIGQATHEALTNYANRKLPAGVKSAGNGTTMRCAPYALALAGLGHRQVSLVADGSRLTHDDNTAAAAAVIQSAAVNLCLATSAEALDPHAFLDTLVALFDSAPVPALALRHREGRFTVLELVTEVHDFLDLPASVAFGHFHNGAYVMETLPAVLACFLTNRREPESAILDAVMGGHDADTVAAMVGNLAGALHGYNALPQRWRGDELEHHDRLMSLADALYAMRFDAVGPLQAHHDP